MSQFISMSMASGSAGDLTRGAFDCTLETKVNDTVAPVTVPGVAVKYNAGATAVTPVASASDTVIGFAARDYMQQGTVGKLVSVMRRGYIAVTAPKTLSGVKQGAQVYLTASGTISASSSSNTALAGAVFMGEPRDGLVEIAYNI